MFLSPVNLKADLLLQSMSKNMRTSPRVTRSSVLFRLKLVTSLTLTITDHCPVEMRLALTGPSSDLAWKEGSAYFLPLACYYLGAESKRTSDLI